MKNLLSAVVLTKNEENKIAGCLKSLSFCDELIIIDDFSTDNTLLKVKKFKKIKIFSRRLMIDFAAQRNFGLNKAAGDWILFVDADETVSQNLKAEILERIKGANGKINGFYLKREDIFLGRRLKFGETDQIRLLRLAKKNKGRWTGRVHETWKVEGRTDFLINPLLHYSHEDISSMMTKINNYSSYVAQSWKEQGRGMTFGEIILYPSAKFFLNYMLNLGFLDGSPGFIMAAMMSFHSFLARSKLYLLNRQNA